MDYDRLALAYNLCTKFIQDTNVAPDRGEEFCYSLFDYDSEKVSSIFSNSWIKYPVLDCICEWLFNNTNLHFKDVVVTVNKCLVKCGRLSYEITEEDLKHPFHENEAEVGYHSVAFKPKDRKKIYQYLAQEISAWDIRYLAHFLIPYNDVNKIYTNNVGNIEGVIARVLETWDRKSPSWNCLKSVLTFLQMEKHVTDIESGVHMQDNYDHEIAVPSYLMYKDHRKNLVIQFDKKWSVETVHSVVSATTAEHWKQLCLDEDFTIKEKEGRLFLIICNNKADIKKISVLLIHENKKSQKVLINDIELATIHKCPTTDYLNVITHNSRLISKQIESIVNKETKEADIEFICGGSLKRMSAKAYEEYEKDYSDQYFTINGKRMEEPLQFPPPICNQKSSVFAQKMKDVILKLKYQFFTIFTHYDSKDHIQFLNLNEEFPLKSNISNDNRILLVFLKTLINIRYTDTINAIDIQDEFKAGETDLKELSIINKKCFKHGNWTIINVVAAPSFKVSQDTQICVNCNLLCKKTLSEESKILDFFSNLLQNAHKKSSRDDAKEQYISMVSKIMCFMATRKALYTVPSLSDNIHEQISSLILSIQQLRILYSKCQKKIITGPLGSGKTVLGLSHLELAYEYCKENSIIFYVIWDDKTLLKQDVFNYANRFNYKSNVDVIVTDIVQLAKDIEMPKVPTPLQLFKSLVEKHVGKQLHFILDEFNGEMLGIEEALSLKKYFETEARLEHSYIVVFPQSIEKHRSFVSHETITKHDKYKYEETGLKLYKLERAMRTSESIFQFLRAFEQLASKGKTVIKLPVQEAQQTVNTSVVGTFWNILQKLFSSLKQPVQQPHKLQQQANQSQQQLLKQQQPKEITTPYRDFVEKNIDSNFEALIDIDRLATAIPDEHLSDVVRTETNFHFNSAAFIGHNIKGTKPLLIHPEEKKTEEKEFIPMLALVLQDICLHYNTKRLFIYNTYHQMTIFYRLLKLLNLNFFHYDESTEWKLLKSNEEIPDLLQYSSYNILTTPEGSRGMEASECICLIENNDCTLKHLTLESMSRATQNLIIVSTSNIHLSKYLSTGHIIKELLREYLTEYIVTHSEELDSEKPYTKDSVDKVTFNINTRSRRFEELLNNIEHIDHPQAAPVTANVEEIIFKCLHPPEKVDKITCFCLSEKSCELRWQHSADKYTVKKKSNYFDWEILASGITSNTFIVDDISIGEICTFSVVADNQVGQSDDSIFSYHHN
ncbi:uncharacterized protein LOC130629467 isoform X2 [Hydractinia symbiolongicarpus]|nr:uncharacterized protein LOC130629467 isoform X2 [Hydractinia symbiolongicarpus]